MKEILFMVLVSFAALASGQKSEIKIFPQDDNKFTTEKIISGLVSKGVKILNVETSFDGKSHAMGFFFDPKRHMGIEQGMILSTGTVDNVTDNNSQENYTSFDLDSAQIAGLLKGEGEVDSEAYWDKMTDTSAFAKALDSLLFSTIEKGDADLSNEIAGLTTFDARTIEIRFVPTADTFYYRYVFASEEYDEFVCSAFNDIFAFYVYEPNGKKINTALVPNQQLPVAINSINAGNPNYPTCPKSNSYLYIKNNGKQNLLYDGFTKVLDIRFKVIPNREYMIKIAIADASDGFWDSAVLLENESIFSYHKSFELHFNSESHIPNDMRNLDEMVAFINKHPSSNIQLIGHADTPGQSWFNYELSILRVKEVKELLMNQGIQPERILEVYKGELMPRYKEDWKNRRVEIFVMGE